MIEVGERLHLPFSHQEIDGKLGFLLGPIQGTDDWQTPLAIYILDQAPNAFIASPRRPKGIDWLTDYYKQVDWEWNHLTMAADNGVIIAWLGAEKEHDYTRCFAQTSRVELTWWVAQKKLRPEIQLVIGIDPSFSGRRYLQYLIQRELPEQYVYPWISDVAEAAIKILK